MTNLEKAVAFLKTTDLPQTYGTPHHQGAYCALGAMVYAIKGPPTDPDCTTMRAWGLNYSQADDLIGLPPLVADQVWRWNDIDRLSFPEIAERIETWDPTKNAG